MKKVYIYLLIIVAFASSCVDPVDIEGGSFQQVLVVEGRISTEPGPHEIHITESAPYGSVFDGVVEPVERAVVYIRDSEGINTVLRHQQIGYYYTPADFQAEIGKGYFLIIEYNDKTYNSRQEFVVEGNEIESIYPVFSEYPDLNDNGVLVTKSGVDIFASYSKQPNTSDYYLWEYSGLHYLQTFPEQFVLQTRRGPRPSPKDCCADCYRNEINRDIIISSFPLGSTETNAKLTFIEDDGYRFSDKYLMTLRRYSMSLETYQFFKLIRQQLEIDGDIFDPPPATIRGNIVNVDDTDELVVGYFYASHAQLDTISIESADLEFISALPTFADDCRVLANTTTVKPDYY